MAGGATGVSPRAHLYSRMVLLCHAKGAEVAPSGAQAESVHHRRGPYNDVLVAEDVWAVFRSASVSSPDVVSAHVASAAAIAAPGTMPLIA